MYKLDPVTKKLNKVDAIKYSENGIRERQDIQEWIAGTPQVLGEAEYSLLIISKELPVNEDKKNGIRLDLLALDRDGCLVVIELKRDDARGDVDWQGIKYAARCSTYSPGKIVELLAEHAECDLAEARRMIIEHIDADVEKDTLYDDDDVSDALKRDSSGTKLAIRIILVAREFHPDVAAACLWLRDSGIEMSCICLRPYKENGDIYVVPEKIIPLPIEADYTAHALPKKNVTDTGGAYATRRNMYANDVPVLSLDQIKNDLDTTLSRHRSSLTPRLAAFLKILVVAQKPLDREEIKQQLYQNKIGDDIGQTGRFLSNISQYLTKPGSGHMRAIVQFDSVGEEGVAGAQKNNYRIAGQYKKLVEEALANKGALIPTQ